MIEALEDRNLFSAINSPLLEVNQNEKPSTPSLAAKAAPDRFSAGDPPIPQV